MEYQFFSDKYMVKAIEGRATTYPKVNIALISCGKGNGFDLPKEIKEEYDGLGRGTKTTKTYYSKIVFQNEISVFATMPKGTKKVKVKPDFDGWSFDAQSGVFHATLEKTRYFVIQADGDIFGSLHVFCDKRKKYDCDKKNIIEFTDGVYTCENCEYIKIDEHGNPTICDVKDDTLIYISENAVVNASIELKGVKNVKICGNGEISLVDRCQGAKNSFEDDEMWGAFRYYAKPNIYIRSGCSNIEIDGPLLNCEFRGIVIRNSKDIIVSNTKMFTSTENADGINCYNACNLLVDNCYIESADDCFCVYNSCDSIPTLFDFGYENALPMSSNIELKNCIMSSNARPVVLGGHATGEKNPRSVVENIYMHDCSVIETPYNIYGTTYEYAMYWSGFLRLISQSEQIVRNLTFKNISIDVTKGHSGKPFHLEVRSGERASYTESRGYRIENIVFDNIEIKGNTSDIIQSLVSSREACGEDDNCGVDNVKIINSTIASRKITKDDIICDGRVANIEIL